MKKVPQRSCLVCRKRAAKSALVRLVLHGAEPVWDREQRQGSDGRAIYVHANMACLSGLGAMRLWQHGFRKPELLLPSQQVAALITTVQRAFGLAALEVGDGSRSGGVKAGRRKLRL